MAEPLITDLEHPDRGMIIVVPGVLGWRNNADAATESQLEAYGPGGRWERRTVYGKRISGHSLAGHLEASGAHEGAALLVIAADRFAKPVSAERLLAAIREVAPDLLEDDDRG